jgi:hypothetical protein
MVAVMEESAVMGKPCMRKTRTREAATCEPDAAASEADAAASETHAAGTHAAAHATKMHSTSTAMHAAATMTATAAAMAPAASEHGRRKRKRRNHRTRGEAFKKLVAHPDLRVELQRPMRSHKRRQSEDPTDPVISNE